MWSNHSTQQMRDYFKDNGSCFILFVYLLLCGRFRDTHPYQVALHSVTHMSIYMKQKPFFS